MTSFAKTGGGSAGGRALRRAANRYVSGKGGRRAASHSATSGRAATGALGQFLTDARMRGVDAALRDQRVIDDELWG